LLSETEVLQQAQVLLRVRSSELNKLDRVWSYWRGKQSYPLVPSGVPQEVRRLAGMCRINLMGLVVDVMAQSMAIDGFRRPKDGEDAAPWAIWQANKMDARQSGIIRSTLAYGTAYGVVLPGDTAPVMRGVSPRRLTALYGDDPDWPRFALEVDGPGPGRYRLYDDEAVYHLGGDRGTTPNELLRVDVHAAGVCPVVRFRNTEDLDEESPGEIESLMPMQDQMDITTFGLLVAQHYQAFRQRYIIGWTSDDENAKQKAAASRMLTFEDPDIKIGEFGQVDLSGYLESRESTVKFMGIVSQTPPHSLLGEMANLAAEALAAAEAGQRRKIGERETGQGESFEQYLNLAGRMAGLEVDDSAQVRWRDTEARSLAQVVDALGKMATMLGIPPQELWERVPGVSQQDVERWKATAAAGDSFANLDETLQRQMGFDSAAEAVEDTTARGIAEMVQKVYLGVGKVLTTEEAREILNRAGAGLTGPGPPPGD